MEYTVLNILEKNISVIYIILRIRIREQTSERVRFALAGKNRSVR